jgi:hypothetical protein
MKLLNRRCMVTPRMNREGRVSLPGISKNLLLLVIPAQTGT